jgi:DNA-binding GntR family transcriptional regulator
MSLTDTAYASIKAAILAGEIAPNAPLDEKSIAAGLGMSRTPVREALLRLQGEGLVEMARGRGIHVRLLSAADMREIYEVLTGLETLAVSLLASPGIAPQGSTAAAGPPAALADALARMEQAAAAGDWQEWGGADEAFHRALLEGCGNGRVRALGLQHRDLIQRPHFVAMRLQPPDYLARSTRAHRALLALIAAGDAERAALAHLQQRRRGEAALMAIIDTYRLASI